MKYWPLFLLLMVGCKGTSTNTEAPTGSTAPRFLQVVNPTNIGFYSLNGDWGFGSSSNSNLSISFPAAPKLVVNDRTGTMILTYPTSKLLVYVDLYKGTQKSTSLSFPSESSTDSIALSSSANLAFVLDSTKKKVFTVDGTLPLFGKGNNSASAQFSISTYVKSPTSIGAFEDYAQVAVTDQDNKTVNIFDYNSGTQIGSSPNPITLDSTSCVSLGPIRNYKDKIYLACNSGTKGYMAVIRGGGSPQLINSISATSLSNLDSIVDFVLAPRHNALVAISSTKLQVLDMFTFSSVSTLDFSSCDNSVSLSGITFSDYLNQIFVSDTYNSRVYKLNGSGTKFSDTDCTTSRFQVTAIQNPTALGFF